MDAVITEIHKSQPNVLARKLQVDKAHHSYHMAEIGKYYHSLIDDEASKRELRKPKKPFSSSVSGSLLDDSMTLGSRYWQKNLESPVLFRSAISSILKHLVGKNPVFLEIGPHSALAGPLRQITQESSVAPYISAMIRNQDCVESLLSAVGKLYTVSVPINLKALVPNGSCLSDLPPYPWDHNENYWYESRLSKEYRLRQYPHHDLLGSRIVESTDFEPSWRNLFHLDTVGWVRDHKVGDDIVFPFAGYIAMAGEAARQVTGIGETFHLRHVIISTALVVVEGRPTEMITTLRRLPLTDTLDSQWWEFSVASHNGRTWTKHCTGEVMSQSESSTSSQMHEAFPRKVESWKWFDTLRQVGLDLGPAFRNLEDISAGTTSQQSPGKVLNNRHHEADKYHLHPTVIDSTIQLLGIAFASGLARKCENRLPTSCHHIRITRSSSNFIVGASTKFTGGSMIGECEGIADEVVVLSFSGLRFSAVDNVDPTETNDTHAAARQEWGPDIEFMSLKDLIKPSTDRSFYSPALEEISHLCLLYSQRCLLKSTKDKPHLQRFRQWIDDQLGSLDVSPHVNLDNEAIFKRIDHLVHNLAGTPAACAANVLQTVCNNIGAIFSGQISSLEALLNNDTIAELYNFIDDCDISLFIQRLAHCNPNLRVLEIGSWRSSASSDVLDNLVLPNGRTLCSKYNFTSKGFISAQESRKKFPNMEYSTLDIEEDPLDHGFEAHKYDLIIARNAIHVTRSISASLRNIKTLLHPAGRLLLQELCPASKWVNYIFGTQSRWWCGLEDGRQNEPYADMKRWHQELVAAGYGGADAVVFDSEEPFQLNGIMIAKPSMVHDLPKQITLLSQGQTMNQGPILQELETQGYEVLRCTIHDSPPSGRDVIAFLDINEPFFANIDTVNYDAFKNFVHSLDNSGVFWVTQLSQLHCKDPRYAQVVGTARTLRSEMSIDFATCEVDTSDSSAAQVVQTFKKFQMRNTNDLPKPDLEYLICNGIINVGRFYPFALSDELLVSDPSDVAVLDIGIPGRPSTLYWARRPGLPALQPDEVEVEMYSVGLNFRV